LMYRGISHSRRSGMDHTVVPAITPMPAFTSQLSPDGASQDWGCGHLIAACLLLIYLPQKDERLSWPGWLTYSGRFAHISGYPSAVDRAQDGKSSPVKDKSFTTVPRNQPVCILW